MTAMRGVPSGRAGRLWLRERLGTAERGAELLDRKLRVLRREQQRYVLWSERTAAEWETACRTAQEWQLRAALLGGRRAAQAATPVDPAEVDLEWTVVMGVRHPLAATVRGGEPDPSASTPSNTALLEAVPAYRAALAAGAQHAVAAEALRRIEVEIDATQRRLRAVQDRWIPRLTEALREIEMSLEERELADGGRLRWAMGRAGGRGEGER